MSWALSLVMVLGLLPGAAAGFSDVSDGETARDVEVLRMMGVLDGYPDGSFRPDGTLTRAQFCKMAVTLMGKADSVGQFQSYTIFPDVRASYWAAGYVNLATRGENKLIAGYPNGTFVPENPITYGQAVTILMRLLGYTDSDVGAVWPAGYLAVAATAGVTQGLTLTGDSNLTRGQAARLFVNLMAAKGKESTTPYGETLASSVQKDVVLLDVDAKADDGTEHGVKTTAGTYKAGKQQPSPILAGSKGTLLLDKDNKVLTFLPERGSTSKTITLVTAKGDRVADVTGQEYLLAGDTVVYRDEGKTTTYGEIFKTLRAGQVVTIYYTPSGAADYVFLGGSTSDHAVVVSQDGSEGGFASLAGGTGYTIFKNGVQITAADLRKNDVAVYDSTARAIRVTDAKLTGVYESVYPNREAPAKLTVMGAELTVLPGAAGMLAPFKLGEKVTLLLTQDNQVAGAIDAKGQSNAVGVVTQMSGTEATVELLQGLTLKGNTSMDSERAAEYVGQLVQVSSYERGKLSIAALSANISGGMDVAAQTVGGSPLAPNVRIYERVKDSSASMVNLEDLTMGKIAASQIDYVRRDWAGRVDLLVLNDATGDRYHYGIISYTAAKTETYEDKDKKERYTETSPATVKVTNGDGVFGPYNTIEQQRNRGYGGLIPTADGKKLAKSIPLEKVGAANAAAWVEDDDFVVVDGTRYPVPEDVQCYNRSSQSWVSLSVARSFADEFVVYADKSPDQGGKVRILEVNQ